MKFIGLSLLSYLFLQAEARTSLKPSPLDSAVGAEWTFDNLTWIENLAVRENGEILCSSINRAALYLVNIFQHAAFLVHQFDVTDGALGITEIQKDVFVVVTANISTATSTAWQGSAKIWKINMTAYELSEPVVTLITNLTEVGLPDGVVAPSSAAGLVLVADAAKGIIWRVDTTTGAYNLAIEDSAFKPTNPQIPLGVDGIHIARDQLYFSNLGSGIIGRIPLAANFTAAGPLTVLANLTFPDDFTVDCDGNIYVVGDNTLWRVSDNGTQLLAGGPNDLTLEGATAAQFGRTETDQSVLYISTNGGLLAPVNGIITGGKILAVNVGVLLQ